MASSRSALATGATKKDAGAKKDAPAPAKKTSTSPAPGATGGAGAGGFKDFNWSLETEQVFFFFFLVFVVGCSLQPLTHNTTISQGSMLADIISQLSQRLDRVTCLFMSDLIFFLIFFSFTRSLDAQRRSSRARGKA
jgi:hypothetical protein